MQATRVSREHGQSVGRATERGHARAGGGARCALSKEVAALVGSAAAAAAQCVPRQGARQLPRGVAELLPALACALKREAARKHAVATEHQARRRTGGA